MTRLWWTFDDLFHVRLLLAHSPAEYCFSPDDEAGKDSLVFEGGRRSFPTARSNGYRMKPATLCW